MSNALRRLAVKDNPVIVEQVIKLEAELSNVEAIISIQEVELNALVDRLYGLSEAEAKLARNDRAFRRGTPRHCRQQLAR